MQSNNNFYQPNISNKTNFQRTQSGYNTVTYSNINNNDNNYSNQDNVPLLNNNQNYYVPNNYNQKTIVIEKKQDGKCLKVFCLLFLLFGCFLLVGCFLCVGGVGAFGYVAVKTVQNCFENLNNYELPTKNVTESFSTKNIDSIFISSSVARGVLIKTGLTIGLVSVHTSIRSNSLSGLEVLKKTITIENNILKIGVSAEQFWPNIDCSLAYIEVILPVGFAPNLNVQNEYGVTLIGNALFSNVFIKQGIGAIGLANLVAQNIKINTGTSAIQMENIVAQDFKIEATNSEMKLKTLKLDTMNIENTNLNIEINSLYLLRSNSESKITTKTGNVRVDKLESSVPLEVTTETGNIFVNLQRTHSCLFELQRKTASQNDLITVFLPGFSVSYTENKFNKKTGSINNGRSSLLKLTTNNGLIEVKSS